MHRLLQAICVLLIAALVTVPFVQVVMRNVVGSAIIGAEELTRVLLIASVFVAYPLVVGARENIGMSEIRNALPGRAPKYLSVMNTLCGLIISLAMAVITATNISGNMNNATPTLGIPFWVFLGAAAVGFAGAAVFHTLRLMAQITDGGR
ncbi:TRAP transporter small permease [Litoreibacter albidus]|uniref:TRAP transporter small permease protein n=1 Tax=Litoreibacter albidus TaxID=670155 RepID=A0A1H3CU76_9RHOB|nr:TRAP transporter small permease subunit [Litoreibacter albidus]SDX57721.1 TRAP-type C4-dicarboxylate transport system, small permease component [Litoreibacter albidus]